jgi:hypothetical protein
MTMMTIGSVTAGYPGPATSSSSNAGATTALATDASTTAHSLSSDQVTLSARPSGQALLMSRVFNAPSNANVPVETIDNAGAISSHFLTLRDRAQLADLYDYASAHSIDLAHVDALASDLSRYRQIGGAPVGQRWDTEGHGVAYVFVASDGAVANRILSGSAIQNTTLDHGFIQNLLDPNQSPTHGVDFKFLEKAMTVLSPSGDAAAAAAGASQEDGDAYFQNDTPFGDGPHNVIVEKMSLDVMLDLQTGKLISDPSASGKSGQGRADAEAPRTTTASSSTKEDQLLYLLDAMKTQGHSAPHEGHGTPLQSATSANFYAKHQSLN